MGELAPAWYILVYHEVSWEDSTHVSHIGGACSPQMFEHHVRTSAELGRLVDIEDGVALLTSGNIDAPLISFWFDDGARGVRVHAAPILEQYGIRGATSICSRFMTRKEMFWRSMLSHLQSLGLASQLASLVPEIADAKGLRAASIARFNENLLRAIGSLYRSTVPEDERYDAFDLFDDIDGVRALHNSGWTIANHTAAHYPILPNFTVEELVAPFDECQKYLDETLVIVDKYWVIPFGKITTSQVDGLVATKGSAITPVLVGNLANTSTTFNKTRALYRIGGPPADKRGAQATLVAASRRIKAGDRWTQRTS